MLIKFLGYADDRRFEVGESLGGRLDEPLQVPVSFSAANNHVVDTTSDAHKDVPRQFWSALLDSDPLFTKFKGEPPRSAWDQTFSGEYNPETYAGQVRAGVEPPGPNSGLESDHYVDLTARVIYGPLTQGEWGQPRPLPLEAVSQATNEGEEESEVPPGDSLPQDTVPEGQGDENAIVQ